MSAKDELHNIDGNLSQKRENIIKRLMNLSDEQFDQLLTLYSQQETESCPTCQVHRRTSA
jgi:hypothetical protein